MNPPSFRPRQQIDARTKISAVFGLANLAGIVVFLITASETWNLDFGLGGLSSYNVFVKAILAQPAAVFEKSC